MRARPLRPGYWFRPRRFGFGVTPASWQGWLVTFATIAIALPVARAAEQRGAAYLLLLVPVLAALLWVMVTRTDGALRWRWGGED